MSNQWEPIETLPHNGSEEDRVNCGHWHGPVQVFIPDEYGGVVLIAQMDADMWIVGSESRSFTPLERIPILWKSIERPTVTELIVGGKIPATLFTS